MGSKVFFISDLHLGHKNISGFSGDLRGGNNSEEHDEWIIEQWNNTVRPKDVVYVLGDVAFTPTGLTMCQKLNGHKKLVMGNHDTFSAHEYQWVGFSILPGIHRYKEFWLSHAPIHPNELRGKRNIHGHVHAKSINDDRYINVCVEMCYGKPIFLDDLRNQLC